MNKLIFQTRDGFTLMEMMVSLAVFMVVFTVGIGAFISAMKTQRQIQALIAANNNASLVIEQMAREIRTSIKFETWDATGAAICSPRTLCERLRFVNAKGEEVDYYRNASSEIMRFKRSPGVPESYAATAENVAVRYLGFKILHTCPNLDHIPRVTIVLGVSPRSEQGVDQAVTEIQTTVASRQGLLCDEAVLRVTPTPPPTPPPGG